MRTLLAMRREQNSRDKLPPKLNLQRFRVSRKRGSRRPSSIAASAFTLGRATGTPGARRTISSGSTARYSSRSGGARGRRAGVRARRLFLRRLCGLVSGPARGAGDAGAALTRRGGGPSALPGRGARRFFPLRLRPQGAPARRRRGRRRALALAARPAPPGAGLFVHQQALPREYLAPRRAGPFQRRGRSSRRAASPLASAPARSSSAPARRREPRFVIVPIARAPRPRRPTSA